MSRCAARAGKPRAGRGTLAAKNCRADDVLPRTAAPLATDAPWPRPTMMRGSRRDRRLAIAGGGDACHRRTATNWPGASPAGRSRGGGSALAARMQLHGSCWAACLAISRARCCCASGSTAASTRSWCGKCKARGQPARGVGGSWATRWPQGRCMSPDGMDVHAAPAGLVVVPGEGPHVSPALPPGDSAILLLSGADPMLVERALSVALGGGLALGQSARKIASTRRPARPWSPVAAGGQHCRPRPPPATATLACLG